RRGTNRGREASLHPPGHGVLRHDDQSRVSGPRDGTTGGTRRPRRSRHRRARPRRAPSGCPACRPSPPAGARRPFGRARNRHREDFAGAAPSPPPRDRRRPRWSRGTRRSAARRAPARDPAPTTPPGQRPPRRPRRRRTGPRPARSPAFLAKPRQLARGVVGRVESMARLRSPGGGPWDREQTPESVRPYVIEEAYEVLEAIERDDPDALRDELGDLLLQVVFQAQLAAEAGRFTITDVARAV